MSKIETLTDNERRYLDQCCGALEQRALRIIDSLAADRDEWHATANAEGKAKLRAEANLRALSTEADRLITERDEAQDAASGLGQHVNELRAKLSTDLVEWQKRFDAAVNAREAAEGEVDRLTAERDEWKARAEAAELDHAFAVCGLNDLDDEVVACQVKLDADESELATLRARVGIDASTIAQAHAQCSECEERRKVDLKNCKLIDSLRAELDAAAKAYERARRVYEAEAKELRGQRRRDTGDRGRGEEDIDRSENLGF